VPNAAGGALREETPVGYNAGRRGSWRVLSLYDPSSRGVSPCGKRHHAGRSESGSPGAGGVLGAPADAWPPRGACRRPGPLHAPDRAPDLADGHPSRDGCSRPPGCQWSLALRPVGYAPCRHDALRERPVARPQRSRPPLAGAGEPVAGLAFPSRWQRDIGLQRGSAAHFPFYSLRRLPAGDVT